MKKISFRKFEHIILPRFRQKINDAESTEDIKKTFVLSMSDLFNKAFAGGLAVGTEDVKFEPFEKPYFSLSKRLVGDEKVRAAWKDSDLQQIIERLAESAMNRYKHLKKHREKTNSKIRMNICL
jgi:hypothetical protein